MQIETYKEAIRNILLSEFQCTYIGYTVYEILRVDVGTEATEVVFSVSDEDYDFSEFMFRMENTEILRHLIDRALFDWERP